MQLRAKESLAAQGVLVESLGGDVLCADISALQGTNINELKVMASADILYQLIVLF